MTKKKTEPGAAVADVIAKLKKEGRAVGSLADFDRIPGGYSSGNIAIDYLTGCGGYPKGRIVEQYGPKSSGKTTSALQALAIEQKNCIENGGYVMFLDYEKSLDENYCKALGLDVNDPSFIYVLPDTFEEGADIFRKILATGELRIGVFDSVAAMITEREAELDAGQVMVADRAKALHQLCRQITPVLARTEATAIFLNHMMIKVDTSPMGQRMAAQGIKQITKPGGTALDFYASLQLEFKQIKHLTASTTDPLTMESVKVATQTETEVKVVKNKVGVAQGKALLRIRFGHGFSEAYSVLQVLLGHGIIKKAATSTTYNFPDGQKAVGEDKAIRLLENDPALLATLEEKAREVLASQGNLMDNAGEEEEENDD